jgi:hypothetical protein
VKAHRVLAIGIAITLASSTCGLVALVAGEREAREAPLFAAVIVYVAKGNKCTRASPCCYSVGGEVPSPELLALLTGNRGLKPIPLRGACGEWTIHVARVTQTAGAEQQVRSGVGGQDQPLVYCTHTVKLTAAGWAVDPAKDSCPAF